jgi:hypothetical protein
MNRRTVTMSGEIENATNRARAVLENLQGCAYYTSELSVGSHTGSGDSRASYSVAETNFVKIITVTVSWSNATRNGSSSMRMISAMSAAIHDI